MAIDLSNSGQMRNQRRFAARFIRLAVACLAVVISTSREGIGQTTGAGNPLVRVGEDAPDFNLPRLTITNDPNGKPIGVIRAADTVRLSSFRGKRPICLIMSSYT
jgi:hypothetical protein